MQKFSGAASLVFSDKAVIREISGKFYLMFQAAHIGVSVSAKCMPSPRSASLFKPDCTATST